MPRSKLRIYSWFELYTSALEYVIHMLNNYGGGSESVLAKCMHAGMSAVVLATKSKNLNNTKWNGYPEVIMGVAVGC